MSCRTGKYTRETETILRGYMATRLCDVVGLVQDAKAWRLQAYKHFSASHRNIQLSPQHLLAEGPHSSLSTVLSW